MHSLQLTITSLLHVILLPHTLALTPYIFTPNLSLQTHSSFKKTIIIIIVIIIIIITITYTSILVFTSNQ